MVSVHAGRSRSCCTVVPERNFLRPETSTKPTNNYVNRSRRPDQTNCNLLGGDCSTKGPSMANPYDASRMPASPPIQRIRSALKSTCECIGFLLSAMSGALVWHLSPRFTGELEPWDSGSGYYLLAIAASACLGGIVVGRRLWIPVLGAYFGQVIYCGLFYRPGGPVIMPIAISAGLFGTLPAIVGAIVGAVPREAYQWIVKPKCET